VPGSGRFRGYQRKKHEILFRTSLEWANGRTRLRQSLYLPLSTRYARLGAVRTEQLRLVED